MAKKLITVFLIISLILCTSCTGKKSDISEKKSSEKNKIDISEKYNAYVEVNNFMHGTLVDVLNYYNKSFGLDKNTFNTEVGSVVVSSVADPELKSIKEKLNFYNNEPSMESLDVAAKDLEPAIMELADVLKEIEYYYDSKNYIDDNFEEGKELHTKICTSYENYQLKMKPFIIAVIEACYEQCQKDMEKYLENNELIKYHSINYMLTSLNLFGELMSQNINSENVLTIDKERYTEQYNELSEEIDKLVDATNNLSNSEKEKFKGQNFDEFINYAQKTKAAAAEILKGINEKDPSLCSAEEFYSNLRTMIYYYNRVAYFSRDIKNLNYFPMV